MQEVVNRGSYSVDQQFSEAKPVRVPMGKKTEVTCGYNNTTDRDVGFGESSNDEMCYLVGYVRGKEGAFGCASLTPPPPDGGMAEGGTPRASIPTAHAMGTGGPAAQPGDVRPPGPRLPP